ncbi:helix-turn-helix transcriptional regulator [Kineosporia sp. J2-2]|uniref:Helix-turn-helix transcriptional regulator n=1 Tax=Kineosporia corallincola TaxID=2835133 RepID=A0ABS5TAN7_9ACTN|nr:helix-turn-helix transcriptional regulator [Kineosporia corallincola]MBT0768135.1 helix-turn-helix transcriptional regulator [Kineosporia corallincola]
MTRSPTGVPRAMRRLGTDLATWRRIRRLTVEELSQRSGVGIATITRLEAGRGATLEHVMRVAAALGVGEVLATALTPRNVLARSTPKPPNQPS